MSLTARRLKRDFLDDMLVFLAFVYTFVSYGLSGVPGVSRLSLISALGMAIIMLIRQQTLHIAPWLLLLITFYIYLIVPVLVLPGWSIDVIAGATTALIGTACIGLALTNNLVNARYIAYAMLAAAITNVIALTLGIDTGQLTSGIIEESRLTGLLGNANVLAINFSLPAIVVWLVSSRIPLPFRLLSLINAFYGIYVSGSRKGVILGGAILMIVAKRLTDNLSRLKQIAILGSVLTISVAYYQYIGNFFDMLNENVLAINRFSMIISGYESSFSERKLFIEKGYQIWMNSPLFGEGLGQFALISGSGTYSHNNYIELLVSGGIIAFLLYYILYALVIYSAYKFHRNELFYAIFVIVTLLFVDTAAVTFSGRSTMLFIAFAFAHFSENSQTADQTRYGNWLLVGSSHK